RRGAARPGVGEAAAARVGVPPPRRAEPAVGPLRRRHPVLPRPRRAAKAFGRWRGGRKPAMNSRFVPGPATAVDSPRITAEAAIVTASYAADFERCRLLCQTIDRFVTGMSRHYILVEERDVARFRALEGAKRSVISERELL